MLTEGHDVNAIRNNVDTNKNTKLCLYNMRPMTLIGVLILLAREINNFCTLSGRGNVYIDTNNQMSF